MSLSSEILGSKYFSHRIDEKGSFRVTELITQYPEQQCSQNVCFLPQTYVRAWVWKGPLTFNKKEESDDAHGSGDNARHDE